MHKWEMQRHTPQIKKGKVNNRSIEFNKKKIRMHAQMVNATKILRTL